MTAAPNCSQPEITLVQDLRMDADMLKDGYQKNLTELWHSDVVREAAKNALRAAARIEELTKALKFYASEWQANGDGDSETPGLSRSWMEPTDELHNDEGRTARRALAVPLEQRDSK